MGKINKTAPRKRSLLSKTLVVDILAIVYENERTNMNDLKILTMDYSTVKKRVDELIDAGLLIKETTSDPTLQYLLHLTDKGEKIGQRMSESLKILEKKE